MESGGTPPERPSPDDSAPPPGPQAPPPTPAAPGPESPPSYGGPVPPGGWEQPIAAPPGWAGQQLASWGIRVAATLLDWLILFVPVTILVVLIVVVAVSDGVAGVAVGIIGGLAYLVAVLFYAPVLMARGAGRNGQTWGKQIVGIRVVRDNGAPVELGFGFLREFVVKALLFGTVGGFFFSIPTLLDVLWPLWDDQNRCLHDMVVSTHVVRT
ncbi:MAG TPA: RDD family protein [Thermoleophilaceae bacterium]|nr:RDD family protein [Thermoleophilaceae bacterium]